MQLFIRSYVAQDIPAMLAMWNQVVEDGVAFPQMDALDVPAAKKFFGAQTYCGVAEVDGQVVGMYILHPNNVGRCGHIANASYAVHRNCRGNHIGEKLVLDSMQQGASHGFRILQFNAVVAQNVHARHLYERIGFHPLGTIEKGFLMPDGTYADICPYWIDLTGMNPSH